MESPEVTEKELKIISQLGKDANITQRQISQNVGLSLGLVNIIVKKLIEKGYVKIRRLNRRNLQYFLTPKGFSQLSRRSYHYFWKTIDSVKRLKEKIQELVLEEYSKGITQFLIVGNGELADIVEISLRDLNRENLKFKRVLKPDETGDMTDGLLLITEGTGYERFSRGLRRRPRYIDIVARLTELSFDF